MRQFSFAKKIQTYALSREKLLKILVYEKAVRKMLVKLTPGSRSIKAGLLKILERSFNRNNTFSIQRKFGIGYCAQVSSFFPNCQVTLHSSMKNNMGKK